MRESTLRRREVYGLLRASIIDGIHPPGSAFVTERELAHNYGLTRAMARTIIRQLERDSLVERLPNGRPVVAAQSWKGRGVSARSSSVHVSVWPGAPGTALANILLGVHRAAGDLGVSITLGPWVDGSWEDRLAAERSFLEQAADDDSLTGVVLWFLGFSKNEDVLRRVLDRGKRLVFIDREPPAGISADSVMSDSYAGAREGVSRLIRAGSRRVALFTTKDPVSSVAQRTAGYRTALRRANIPHDPGLEAVIQSSRAKSLAKSVSEAMDQVLEGPQPATAFFGIQDYIASLVVHELARRGIQVPEDALVIGFDGLARWDRSMPDVAGPIQQFAAIGERAIELIWGRATGEVTGDPVHVLFEAPFRHGATFPGPGQPSADLDD